MFSRLNKRIFSTKGFTIATIATTAFFATYTYTRRQPLPQIQEQNTQNIVQQTTNHHVISSIDQTPNLPEQQQNQNAPSQGRENQVKQTLDIDRQEKKVELQQSDGDKVEQSNKQLSQTAGNAQNVQISASQNDREGKKQQFEKKVKNKIKGKIPYHQISQIPEFTKDQLIKYQFSDQDFVLMVADLPYNRQFQQQILTKIRNILKKRKSNEPLQIYRVDTKNPQIKDILMNKFGASISQQTILLLKHPYERSLAGIQFDMIIRSPQILPVFLSDINIIRNHQCLERNLKSMSPHKTFLLFIVDQTSPDYSQILLSAKYIQMELQIQNLQNIKLLVMDQQLAKNSGLSLSNPKVKSMHLIRKSNQFTYKPANRFLFGGMPYHILQNINLFDKKREMMIQKYLNKIQTFSSMAIEVPYVCYITIDRNKITPREEREVLNVFSKLKSKQQFPHVSFIVKFAEVPYRGNQQQPFGHKRWSVMVANVDELTKQTYMHEIKNHNQAKKLGINEQNWQKNTYEFLYRQPELNEESLKEFIQKCVEGKQNFYYKTQKKIKMQKLNKITGQNFQQQIIQDTSRSHWMFEYSDHCASCSMIAPIMQNFAQIVQLFPNLKSRVHGMNCDKNRLKGQPYSPYTPNLYYYSRNWGNKWPIRYPLIDLIQDLGIKGMYDFSEITETLRPVNLKTLQKHIQQVQKYKNVLQEL